MLDFSSMKQLILINIILIIIYLLIPINMNRTYLNNGNKEKKTISKEEKKINKKTNNKNKYNK